MLFPTFQDETHCNLQVNMAKERWNTVPMFSGFLSVLHMARQKWGTITPVPLNRSDVRDRAKEDPFQHLSLLVSFIYLLFSAKSGGCSVYLNFLKPYFIFVYLFVG